MNRLTFSIRHDAGLKPEVVSIPFEDVERLMGDLAVFGDDQAMTSGGSLKAKTGNADASPWRQFVALFQVVLRRMGGDESRFGDCSGRAGLPPRFNGQDLVEGATIVIGGRDWLVADASTHFQTKFVCTPIRPPGRAL